MLLLPQRTEIETGRAIETIESSRTGAENIMDMAIGQRESVIQIRSAPAVATEIKKQLGTGTDTPTTTTKDPEGSVHGIGTVTGNTRPHKRSRGDLHATIIKRWVGTMHARTVMIGDTAMESRAATEQSLHLHIPPAPQTGMGPENAVCQVKTTCLRSAAPRNTKNQ